MKLKEQHFCFLLTWRDSITKNLVKTRLLELEVEAEG